MHRRCDSRCVNAVSLTCSCACEGKNHGTGAAVRNHTFKRISRKMVRQTNKRSDQMDLLLNQEEA